MMKGMEETIRVGTEVYEVAKTGCLIDTDEVGHIRPSMMAGLSVR